MIARLWTKSRLLVHTRRKLLADSSANRSANQIASPQIFRSNRSVAAGSYAAPCTLATTASAVRDTFVAAVANAWRSGFSTLISAVTCVT